MSENTDEFDVCQNIEPHETAEEVKSNAVVKYSANQAPVKFHRLRCNTNLNLPPSNWLNSTKNYGIFNAIYQSPGFTSFRMAHTFPDCVGGVDVICDAENIKRLLKLPYNTESPLSMIVHKIGNTLLLDEFDAQKYLLRTANDDWKWLREFILEEIFGETKKNFTLHDKSRAAMRKKNLFSKFLYYSLKPTVHSPDVDEKPEKRPPLPIMGPVLPEPKLENNVPDFTNCHVFNRNLVWTFEDIRMLIGTDMPIFGGPNRPCISLRLREMTQPINVLTGIDYWLDNLMCNVPEVLMCYHLDGIVQKYEVIKTEDLPYLENSKFSPKVVRNVAQNILAFLKANATKSGHTYWLFKGRNDDVVKLYDLTTLCDTHNNATEDEQPFENPFTVPVGMLLYNVARNMKNTSKRITPKTAGNIKSLLDNCLKLLSKDKYPQIVTSSHYILSDLYIPAGIDPKDPVFDGSDRDSDSPSVYDEEEINDDMVDDDDLSLNEDELADDSDYHNVAMKNICETLKEVNLNQKRSKRNAPRAPSPLNVGTEERCRKSLEHIGVGMLCLDFFNRNEEEYIKESEARVKAEEKERILYEEQHPNMAKSGKPIPLPYDRLPPRRQSATSSNASSEQDPHEATKLEKPKKSKSQRKKERKEAAKKESKPQYHMLPHQIALSFNTRNFGSWNVHLKLLMLEKATLAYATLAESDFACEKYGSALRAVYLSSRCQEVVIMHISAIKSQKSHLLTRAGDCFLQMAKKWDHIDEYLEQYTKYNQYDFMILNGIRNDATENHLKDLIVPIKHLEGLLVASCECYERAIQLSDKSNETLQNELTRRYGNICNELGLKYMYWSQEEYTNMLTETFGAVGEHIPSEDDDLRVFVLNATLGGIGNILDPAPVRNKNKKPFTTGTESASMVKTNDQLSSIQKFRKWVLKNVTPDSRYVKLSQKSYEYLNRGINAFKYANDITNIAFLYCNMGRYWRFRAYLIMPYEEFDGVAKQKKFYNMAFDCYEKAKEVLVSRRTNPDLWDLINWELDTAIFTLAKQMQDHTYIDNLHNQKELEKDVLDMLMKALKHCDVEYSGSRLLLYSYRSAIIHRRIASLHYQQLRSASPQIIGVNKHLLQLCKQHYDKSASILEGLKECHDYLLVQLERISLQDFQSDHSNANSQKIKHMQCSLDIFLESKTIFFNAIEFAPNDSVEVPESLGADFLEHMTLFKDHLESTLKILIKLLLLNKKQKCNLVEMYKKMYKEALDDKRTANDPESVQFYAQTVRLRDLIERLVQIRNSHENSNNGEHKSKDN